MSPFPDRLATRLAEIYTAGLGRRLDPAGGIDLSSNDYLGFATDPVLGRRFLAALRGRPVGSTGSRLLRGESELHREVEAALAAFVSRETALLFPSGYQANLGLLSSLLRSGDTVFSDALNHASIIDGIRLGKAERVIYPHADTSALRQTLERFRYPDPTGLRVIVTESLFSVDGDLAPLRELADLADEFGALLIVDEAHATGLLGAPGSGGGLVQALGLTKRVFATVHTGGKALGAGGAWVAGDAHVREYLVNTARPFIFTTAPIPALPTLLRLSIDHWAQVGGDRAREVLRRAAAFRGMLRSAVSATSDPVPGVVEGIEGPIVPFVIGDNRRAMAAARRLQENGFDARAIRPPTVPEGTARLRLTVTWPVGEATLARFTTVLCAMLQEEEVEA
ncbi:MAG: 8-amino-7-oxononanoate synthase [Acidobacteriota bacterium]